MNNKTTKTILFAGIIAAMILPFSSMGLAEAIEETRENKIKKIQEQVKKLDKLQEKITKYSKLAEKYTVYDRDGKANRAQHNADKATKTYDKLYSEFISYTTLENGQPDLELLYEAGLITIKGY